MMKMNTGENVGPEDAELSDRVAEANGNKPGESPDEKTARKIDWICEQAAYGTYVLDIGCSQGIAEILLGRKGIRAVGVDSSPEAVEYAESMLAEEPEEVRQKIRFVCADLTSPDIPQEEYDVLILSEILEHLQDPWEFLRKAASFLKENGRIIITVPFGINDFPDHKHTFYTSEIWENLRSCSKIEQVVFFDGWIGFTAVKAEPDNKDSSALFPLELLRREEAAFFTMERSLRDQIKADRESRNTETAELRKKLWQIQMKLSKDRQDRFEEQSVLMKRIEATNLDPTWLLMAGSRSGKVFFDLFSCYVAVKRKMKKIIRGDN